MSGTVSWNVSCLESGLGHLSGGLVMHMNRVERDTLGCIARSRIFDIGFGIRIGCQLNKSRHILCVSHGTRLSS